MYSTDKLYFTVPCSDGIYRQKTLTELSEDEFNSDFEFYNETEDLSQ